MRVLSFKFQCSSFTCFSKSAPALYSPAPLNLEDAQHVSSSPSPVAVALEEKISDEKIEIEKSASSDGKVEFLLKSCLKKSPKSGANEVGKGRIKWMDVEGKELVQIREFQATESGDKEDDFDQSCICVIQ